MTISNYRVGDKFGSYELTEYRGCGAHGDVFRAVHMLLNRTSALKVIPCPTANDFKAHIEGQIAAKCEHEHTVIIHDVVVGEKNNVLHAGLAMEFIEGVTALQAIKKYELSFKSAIKLIIQILFALSKAHQNKILHRDVKPENIMITEGIAKLTDFGVAAALEGRAYGSAKGTPVFSAPEVFNKGQTDERTEVFAVGMSLFQMLNRTVQWGHYINSSEQLAKGQTIELVGFRDFMPDKFKRLIRKACHFDPNKRFQNMIEIRQALEKLNLHGDWICKSELHWECTLNCKIYNLNVVKRHRSWQLQSKKGNKNHAAWTSSHTSEQQAVAQMHAIIKETTFS